MKALTQSEFDALLGAVARTIRTRTRPVAVPGEAILGIEAVARCCDPDKSKNGATAIEYSGLRGFEGVRVATMLIGDRTIRIAVCNGLINAQKLIIRNLERLIIDLDLLPTHNPLY